MSIASTWLTWERGWYKPIYNVCENCIQVGNNPQMNDKHVACLNPWTMLSEPWTLWQMTLDIMDMLFALVTMSKAHTLSNIVLMLSKLPLNVL